MTDPFVTSVKVEERGHHDTVHVFVEGQNVGALVCGKGHGERLRNILLSEKYFGTGRTPDAPIEGHDLVAWRVMATNWLDLCDINTSEPGAIGRMVLRLLDRIQDLEDELERPARPRPPSLVSLILEKKQALFVDDVPWFAKDFRVLYLAAKRVAEACRGVGEDEGRPYPALKNLEAQLERLQTAFQHCEAVRLSMVQRGAR